MNDDRPLRRVPASTYRIQVHRGFGFADVRAIVGYLARLGISDLYLSPYLAARPGSTHGYDICDHSRLNPELGGEAAYASLLSELAQRDMGHLLDFVPNHMGIDPASNRWWRDVLENGPSSPFARFFDIDWEPVKQEIRNKVLLPILGDAYGLVLERGELRLEYAEGALRLRYFDHDLPINPRSAPRLLRHDVERLKEALGEDHPSYREFLSIATELQNLPAYTESLAERIAERQREKEVARERLQRLVDSESAVREHLERCIRTFNGTPGDPASFDCLHDLLEAQAYRLAYWRTAFHEINYRRFFDINDLAGLRMEEPDVFEATHGLVLRLVREGKITGLRLDHLDGLFDPLAYLRRLRESVGPLYVIAEKILSSGERLPDDWPIEGTSGYEFLNELAGVLVDPTGAKPLRRLYATFTGRTAPFAIVMYVGKKLITQTALSSELNVLAHALNRISEDDRRSRDFTLEALREALREVVACFPVYRTYVGAGGPREEDRRTIDQAIERARRRNPAMEPSIFGFLREVLIPDAERLDPPEVERRLGFAMRFQQYTGPVQAKGLEDTAFYRLNVLLSLNEVGGDP
ncbi:MAG: malto-oligosyltrehalose synthase, partial [Candidatus Binatia bacterium]